MEIILRLAIIGGALGAWFTTQKMIASMEMDGPGIGDRLHHWTAGLHAKISQRPNLQKLLLITSSLGIDIAGIGIIIWSLVGPGFGPFVGLVVLFALRQLCQFMSSLPPPKGILWQDPGVPSLLVTYKVANDFFFSGHTALAVFAAIEVARNLGGMWIAAAIAFVLFEMFAVILTRAHWTMDIVTGTLAAVVVAMLYPYLGF